MEGERTRQLVSLILESFRSDDIASLCERYKVPLSQLSNLREAFIAAGSRRIHDLSQPQRWIQVNISLDPLGFQWVQFVVDSTFHEWLDNCLRDGRINTFLLPLQGSGSAASFFSQSRRVRARARAHSEGQSQARWYR